MDVLETMRVQIRYRFEELCHESQCIPYFFSVLDKPPGFIDPDYENLKDAILEEGGEWGFTHGFPVNNLKFQIFSITSQMIAEFEANSQSIEGIPSIDEEIGKIVKRLESAVQCMPMCKIATFVDLSTQTMSTIGMGHNEFVLVPSFLFSFFLWGDNPELESQEAREARLAFIQEYEQSGPHDTVEVVSNE